MSIFQLDVGDVLLFINDKTDWQSRLSRWAVGDKEHVAMYLGKGFNNSPFLVESSGRGVWILSLRAHTDRRVLVMRPRLLTWEEKERLVSEGIKLASNRQAYYDYFTIVNSVIPRVLKEKFPWVPIPVKYHRDIMMICSELVAEIYWRAGIDIFTDKNNVLLPGDFEDSPILTAEYTGTILQDIFA